MVPTVEEALAQLVEEITKFMESPDPRSPSMSVRKYFVRADGSLTSVWITASVGVVSKP